MRALGFLISTFWVMALSAQVSFEPQSYTDDFFGIFRHCVVDMNGDHKDDIVGVTGSRIDIAYQTDLGFENQTFHQNFNVPKWSISAGDIDNNGFNDLCLGGEDRASFVYSYGNGTKLEETIKPAGIFSQRSNFHDIDNDGHLDAFVCHDLDQNHPYRNDGTGQLFLDQTLITTPEGMPGNYVSTWVDYDNDGDTDMYLTKCVLLNTDPNNPALINQLYNNDGAGNFTEVAESAGLDDNGQSWVSHWEDFDNDGDFDVFITNHNQNHRLMRNNGDGTFSDVIDISGIDKLGVITSECFAADFDNDGDIDIMMDKPNVIYYNKGNMSFVSSPIVMGMGAIGDLNSDGFLDMQYADKIYYNQGNDNNWLRINPIGRSSNRNGIGARMELYGGWGRQVKELRSGTSWTPMSTLGMHFGIGQYSQIDSLVIKWPSGMKTVIENPAINQALTVDEWNCPVGLMGLEVDGPTSLCQGETVTLSAPENFIYQWSTGETTSSIVVSATGVYSAELINPDTGCNQFTTSVFITNETDPLNLTAPDGTSFCSGTPVRLEINTNSRVMWSNGDSTKTIWVSEPGEYFAEFENVCGDIIQSETITLEEIVLKNPEVADTYVSPGGDAFLVAEPGEGTILWWGDLSQGSFINQGDLFITNITHDTIYYAQRYLQLPEGEACATDRIPVYVYVTTNSTEDIDEAEIHLFPNPATDHLIIKTPDHLISSYKVMDVTGAEITSDYLYPTHALRLSTDAFSVGLYFVQLAVGDNLITRQFIVTR